MSLISTILTKIWYSQTHLNLLNFIKGQTAEITETNPLDNQIGVHYIKVNWFIRSITSGRIFNPFVLIAYIFFFVLHTVTVPFYISVFTYQLLVNVWRVYVYTQNPEVLEVRALSVFKRFPNQWVELVYNMVYRRAVVAAFVTIYKLLQLIKSPRHTSTGVRGSFTLLFKLLLLLLVRIVWVSLFQVSWQIVSRSYRFAMAFSSEYSYKHFNINIIRGRIINNYQLDDLRPGLYLRIYKDDKSKWNFNPDLSKYLYNRKASHLTESIIFKNCMEGALDDTSTFVYNNHVTCGYVIGNVNGRQIEVITNNTSGCRTGYPSSWISYESDLPIKSKIQSMTSLRLVFTDSLDKKPVNYGQHDFRTFMEDHRMPNLFLVGKLFTRDQSLLHPLEVNGFMRSAGLASAQFTMDSELKDRMRLIKQLYGSSPLIDESYTSIDELSYFIQVLHHHEPNIFTNVHNFKLHKFTHDHDDFSDGF